MKVEFVDPFVRAVLSVLEALIKDKPDRGTLSMRAVSFTTQQVSILAGVNGDVEGAVLYEMSLVTAQKIASAIMQQQISEMDDKAWSAIGEMGNMITEKAVQYLSGSGYECQITPPSVLRGINTEVSTSVPALVVPMTAKLGRIEINVALTEKQSEAA